MTPVNDAPEITVTTFNVDQYDNVTFNIPVTDDDSNSFTYSIVTDPSQGSLEDNGSGSYTYYNDTDADIEGSNTLDTFVVQVNDGSANSAETTLTFDVAGIDQTKPQIILTSDSSSITETDAGGATLTVNAILVSNDFYSNKRDMDAVNIIDSEGSSSVSALSVSVKAPLDSFAKIVIVPALKV